MSKFNKDFFDKFPILYKKQVSISCGDGWYNLLYELSEKIENILKNDNRFTIKVDQIKEKFGILRFYISFDFSEQIDNEDHFIEQDIITAPIYSLISEADAKSMQTCEICGRQPAGQMGTNWIHTICESCYNIKSIIE